MAISSVADENGYDEEMSVTNVDRYPFSFYISLYNKWDVVKIAITILKKKLTLLNMSLYKETKKNSMFVRKRAGSDLTTK